MTYINGLKESTKLRIRGHVFRAWTAVFVLAAFFYALVYRPETLTWWKRSTSALIEAGCALLPYPWGDRIEATIGNFGLWVQITLAIVAFRIVVWLPMAIARLIWGRRQRSRPFPEAQNH
jgi:hypothetical protein